MKAPRVDKLVQAESRTCEVWRKTPRSSAPALRVAAPPSPSRFSATPRAAAPAHVLSRPLRRLHPSCVPDSSSSQPVGKRLPASRRATIARRGENVVALAHSSPSLPAVPEEARSAGPFRAWPCAPFVVLEQVVSTPGCRPRRCRRLAAPRRSTRHEATRPPTRWLAWPWRPALAGARRRRRVAETGRFGVRRAWSPPGTIRGGGRATRWLPPPRRRPATATASPGATRPRPSLPPRGRVDTRASAASARHSRGPPSLQSVLERRATRKAVREDAARRARSTLLLVALARTEERARRNVE